MDLSGICSGSSSFTKLCSFGSEGKVGEVLGPVINLIFFIAAIIALVFLVIGGIKWITSSGEEKNVEGARNQIIAAAVGLGITFLSYLLINILLTFFLGNGLNSITLPTLK